MTREEAIEILKAYPLVIKDQQAIQEAIEIAISSLETDEAYQLEYEKPTIIDWNNCHTDEQLKQASLEGFIEYAKKTFGVELRTVKSDNPDTVEKLFGECKTENLCDSCDNKACEFQSGIKRSSCDFYMSHLRPDYCGNYVVQEPTTKKCTTCAYREINGKPHEMCKSCVCGDRYKEEPTTKNNLGVDAITMEQINKYVIEINKILEEEKDDARWCAGLRYSLRVLDKYCGKEQRNDLSSGLEKNSKKLEKDFGELDCISRAQTQTEIEMSASRYTIAKERGGMGQVEWSDQLIKVSDAVDIIRNLPSVTPQEPKTGYWIANAPQYDMLNPQYICSECGNAHTRITPYCEMCGAKMVEPQESERDA